MASQEVNVHCSTLIWINEQVSKVPWCFCFRMRNHRGDRGYKSYVLVITSFNYTLVMVGGSMHVRAIYEPKHLPRFPLHNVHLLNIGNYKYRHASWDLLGIVGKDGLAHRMLM